jgi:hypothetical protein
VTLIEAADIIGIKPDTLRQQIARGKVRATKRGRDWWVTPGEVARYRLDSQGYCDICKDRCYRPDMHWRSREG